MTTEELKEQAHKEFDKDNIESMGAIRALKWAKFLLSYKSPSLTTNEIEKFIKELEGDNIILKNLDRY